MLQYLLLAAGSFLAAFISGAAGFGGSLLLLPLVTACVGPALGVPVLTVAQLMGNIARMAGGWREIDWKSVGLFSITSLPLAALGAFGFSLLPQAVVSRWIGLALILLVAAKGVSKRELPHGTGTLLIGGAVTGGLSGLCGSGGPIGAAVFLSLNLPPVAYIASEAATATAMHLLKIVFDFRQGAALCRIAGYQLLLDGEIVRRADHLVDVADGFRCQSFWLLFRFDAVYSPAVQQVLVEPL